MRWIVALVVASIFLLPIWLPVVAGSTVFFAPRTDMAVGVGVVSSAEAMPGIVGWRFVQSALTALLAGVGAVVMGLPMALAIGAPGRKSPLGLAALIGPTVVIAVLPGFIVAQGFVSATVWFGQPTTFTPVFLAGQERTPLAGALGVAAVGAFTGWPLAGALMGWPLRARRAGELEALAVWPRGRRFFGGWWRVEGSRIAPFAAAAVALVGARTFLDSASPPLLGQRAFAQEIWFAYSQSRGLWLPAVQMALMAACVTVGALTLVVVVAGRRIVRTMEATTQRPIAGKTAVGRVMVGAWIAIVAITLGGPIVAQLAAPHADIPWSKIFTERHTAIVASAYLACIVGFGAAGMSLCVSIIVGEWDFFGKIRAGIIGAAAVMIFAWPPHAAAFGLLPMDAWVGADGPTRWLDEARLIGVLVLRFSAVAVAVAVLALARVPRGEIEAAQAAGLRGWRRWRIVHGRRQWRASACAGLVVALLAIADREATEVLAPPGVETITATLFQLLHFGADSVVLGLVLILVLMTTVTAGLFAIAVAVGFRFGASR